MFDERNENGERAQHWETTAHVVKHPIDSQKKCSSLRQLEKREGTFIC